MARLHDHRISRDEGPLAPELRIFSKILRFFEQAAEFIAQFELFQPPRHAGWQDGSGHFGNALEIAGADVARAESAMRTVDLDIIPFGKQRQVEGTCILAIAGQGDAEILQPGSVEAMII